MPRYARAIYDFRGAQAGDLSFNEDDIIVVAKQDESGWWIGEHTVDGRKGEFPFNYVEVISEAEAERATRRGAKESGSGRSSSSNRVGGDRVAEVTVSTVDSSSRRTVFKVEASLKSGKTKKSKKALGQFRELDRQLRKVFPSFERALPPRWTDGAKLGPMDAEKREKTVESYLNKLCTNDTSSLMTLLWLFPSEQVDLSGASAEVRDAAQRALRAAEDKGSGGKLDRIPTLAKVEFTWKPQDDVELPMKEGQIIEVLTQETGSPGWWQGKTVDGVMGLFPFNHVELLDERVAQAVINGTSLSRALDVHYKESQGGYAMNQRRSKARSSLSRISLGAFQKASNKLTSKGSGSSSKALVQKRQKKVVYPFTVASCDSFDRLLDNGFSMETPSGELLSMTPPSDAPKDGDFVQLSYCAYLWDNQQQSIIEFAASDNVSKSAEPGPMEFFVGNGEVIKGVEYAVMRMKQNQTVRLIVTPQLAYGAVGLPGAEVPPHAHIVYDLTLDAFGSDVSAASASASAYTQDDSIVMANSKGSASSYSNSGSSKNSSKPSRNGRDHREHKHRDRDHRDRDRDRDRDHRDRNHRKPSKNSKSPRSNYNPPKGKDMSLADAIAMRRAKLDNGGGAANIMKPVQERAPRQNRIVKPDGFAGRDRVEVSNEPASNSRKPKANRKENKPSKLYTLKQLQDAVRDKRLRELNIDPSSIEDWLTDDEFRKAFSMSRSDFLLKPRWRQAALKRGMRLF